MQLNLSQGVVADACRVSRKRYGLMERGALAHLTIDELNRAAAVLGLTTSVRIYPSGTGIRDAGQAGKLDVVARLVRAPLTCRFEVSLPAREDRVEVRAWDLMLLGHGARTAIELEMRLRDVQALRRRHELKRRDDPTEAFVLLIADTRANRRVLAEYPELYADLPRLRPSQVRAALANGRHPPTGLLLI
jgi:hypothetical protein